jgi:hypothetical protein
MRFEFVENDFYPILYRHQDDKFWPVLDNFDEYWLPWHSMIIKVPDTLSFLFSFTLKYWQKSISIQIEIIYLYMNALR